MTITLTDTNFKNEVLECTKPIMVIFESDWSGACHIITPIVEKLTLQYQDRLTIGRVNVDDNRKISKEYGVWELPTIHFINNGLVVDRITGIVSKHVITDKLNRLFFNEK